MQSIDINKEDFGLFNFDSERGLIANLILNNNEIDSVHFLQKEHFYFALHGEMFDVIKRCIDSRMIADVDYLSISLSNNPIALESLKESSVNEYLLKTINSGFLSFASAQAQLIHKLYMRRKVLTLCAKLATEIRSQEIATLDKVISVAEDELYSLTEPVSKNTMVRVGDYFKNIVDNLQVARKSDINKCSGLASGLKDLDDLLGGFKPSDLVILAARPSMGKTALAISMACNMAKKFMSEGNNDTVAFFSLEMSSEQIANRVITSCTRTIAHELSTGIKTDSKGNMRAMSDDEFEEIAKNINDLESLPLYIDSTPGVAIGSLRKRIKRFKRLHNCKVVIVDYLQLLTGNTHNNNRVQEVAEITAGLKGIAKELGIPVIALSQLSREVEKRDNNRPQLSDLRESGTIEQDADIVMFLYRESYYIKRKLPSDPGEVPPQGVSLDITEDWHKRKSAFEHSMRSYEETKNHADLIVAKNRNGKIGDARLHFDDELISFSNLANPLNVKASEGHISLRRGN